jgi:myosin heavy subunit
VVNQATKKIKGAEIVNYLLEKSRITNQGINERNFHIFYHVLSGLSADELMKFKLATAKGKIPPEEFDYLKSSQCYTASGINDVALFEEIKQSIRMLGFQTFYENILSIVAAVLLLGNVKFDESTYGNDTPCSLKDLVAFQAVADLLEMNIDDLKAAVTLKQVTV